MIDLAPFVVLVTAGMFRRGRHESAVRLTGIKDPQSYSSVSGLSHSHVLLKENKGDMGKVGLTLSM